MGHLLEALLTTIVSSAATWGGVTVGAWLVILYTVSVTPITAPGEDTEARGGQTTCWEVAELEFQPTSKSNALDFPVATLLGGTDSPGQASQGGAPSQAQAVQSTDLQVGELRPWRNQLTQVRTAADSTLGLFAHEGGSARAC